MYSTKRVQQREKSHRDREFVGGESPLMSGGSVDLCLDAVDGVQGVDGAQGIQGVRAPPRPGLPGVVVADGSVGRFPEENRFFFLLISMCRDFI